MLRALDLFCGAGGASMGLSRAGFQVVGVDCKPQPNYPFQFIQDNALSYSLEGFDLIWASPPCQRFIRSGTVNKRNTEDLLTPIRKRLEESGIPWVIENVPGAPMRADVTLCGSKVGLPMIRRHRWFEASFKAQAHPMPCDHSHKITGVYGNPHGVRGAWSSMLPSSLEVWSKAMDIYWMTARELTQAIPPAYSQYLATQFKESRS